ncbi:endonuclease [Brevundimonas diminuta]|uniref:Z1 domain-containing protein n=1 Tax=Brevundimonas diminuta TaxID=293 RepID=UPI00168B091A|nr:Z1 domain-containing protein [Brevundimonas diminuta]MBD3574035.1 endonuclease [Brevundimonas diminuta]
MSDTAYDLLRTVVRPLIARAGAPTPEAIRAAIGQFRVLDSFSVSDDQAEQLAREIESQFDIHMTIGGVVQDEGFTEWYPAAKARIEPYYWDRYRMLMEERNFAPQVLATMDGVTDRIAGLLEDPAKPGEWDRRGMVVGHVQSGKTANYTGLICKAADAGYKLIVVIAGIHNNLRNQTQQRIDEGFVGRDSGKAKKPYIGVSKFSSTRTPITLTNATSDFNSRIADAAGMDIGSLNVPLVLVIKKNMHTLRNLTEWLRAHNIGWTKSLVDYPMLLIDDEADNASINTSANPDEATKINQKIRELLNLFNRKCYVGYTATPFANIFIDPDTNDEMLKADLFPRNFIVTLDAPSNYFGASRIFQEETGGEFIRPITDNATHLPMSHKQPHVVTGLPDSLEEAVRAFVIARTLRVLRGQGARHTSMLVNASRFTAVQKQLRNLIHDYLNRLVRAVRHEASRPAVDALSNEHLRALHDTWVKEYQHLGHAWADVQEALLEGAAPIGVVEVNSGSAGTLAYDAHEETGLQVIAVGGFSLSRGLTLEGLTISYFLRNSMMYDTLLQMGRWFGYRPGYEDLCRIWMPPETRGWYEHISESIEELRDELRRMERLKLTPEQFGLRVRAHPDTLIVTARNKMRTAQSVPMVIGLSNRFVETYALWSDTVRTEANRKAAVDFVDAVRTAKGHDGSSGQWSGRHRVWQDVDHVLVEQFIRSFRNNDRSLATQSEPVAAFIREVAKQGQDRWDVAIVGVSDSGSPRDPDLDVHCQRRTGVVEKEHKDLILVGTKSRVSSRGVEAIGLSEEELKIAKDEFTAGRKASDSSTQNIPDRAYRRVRKRPLLVIQPIHLTKEGDDNASLTEKPLVTWGVSFPPAEGNPPTVEYAVARLWWQQYMGEDTSDEELDGE